MEENKNINIEESESKELEDQQDNLEEPVVEEVKDVPQEEENVVLDKNLGITQQTYQEFFDMNGGIKQQLKSTIFLCVAMCLIIYLFRDKENPDWGKMGLEMAIYCGIIILFTAVFIVVSRFIITPKQYKKSNIQNIVINFKFSNLGIRQTIDDSSALVHWTSLTRAIETNNSFFFIGMNKRGLLFSKDGMDEEEIQIVRGLCQTKLEGFFEDKRKEEK